RPAREDPGDLARPRPCQRRGHLEEALPAAQLGSDGRERDLRAPRAPAPRGQRREPPRRREADLHAVASPMRKLVYLVASTLDGFIAGPDGSYGFFPFSADSELARHLRSEYPETLPTALRRALGFDDPATRACDRVVRARGTSEPAWKEGLTSPYRHLRQVVFSRSMSSPNPEVEVVADEPGGFVRALKREDGKHIWLCGGAELAGVLWPE